MEFFSDTSPIYEQSPSGGLWEIAQFLKATPDAWCKYKEARSAQGVCVAPTSPWARSWCLLGLMERFIPDAHVRQVALGMLMKAMPTVRGIPTPVHAFNDDGARTLLDVIKALEEAANQPPGAPMNQQEYGANSSAYNKMLYQAHIKAMLPKVPLPDWKALSCAPPLPKWLDALPALQGVVEIDDAVIAPPPARERHKPPLLVAA